MNRLTALLVALVFATTIFSCTKSTNSSNSTSTKPPQPKLQCYENGVLYNYDAAWDSTLGWINYPAFQLDSENVSNQPIVRNVLNGNNSNNFIWLGLPNLLTTVGSYYGYDNNGSSNALLDAQLGSVNASGIGNNSDTINVTSLSNGKASGTFVATIQLNNNTTLHITNGTFSNLPIYH